MKDKRPAIFENLGLKIISVVVDPFNKRINRLFAEVILHSFSGKRICLVNEQNAPQRTVYNLRYLPGCLADVARHQAASIRFNQLALAEEPQFFIDFGNQAGNGCFTSSRIASKNHVETHIHNL